jgi:hypothetical protein
MIVIMKNYQRIVSIVFIFLGLSAMVAEAGNLYRYRNNQGNLVIDYAVPPKYVSNGYEILSESGTVIDVIEPQVDPEDMEPEEVQRSRSEAEAARQKEDEMLLRTYSEIAELEAAMDRKLKQLDREIEIIQSNLEKNEKALDASRVKAANYQLGGRHVPKALLKNMDSQIHEQRDGENMLVVRQQEYQGTKDRYLGYLDRLKTLKGINKGKGLEKDAVTPEAIIP